MNSESRVSPSIGFVLFLLLAPAMAMAYFDPGNGAFMVQALFTMVGAALFYLRHPIRSLKSFSSWLLARTTGRTATVVESEQAENSATLE